MPSPWLVCLLHYFVCYQGILWLLRLLSIKWFLISRSFNSLSVWKTVNSKFVNDFVNSFWYSIVFQISCKFAVERWSSNDFQTEYLVLPKLKTEKISPKDANLSDLIRRLVFLHFVHHLTQLENSSSSSGKVSIEISAVLTNCLSLFSGGLFSLLKWMQMI